MAYTDIHIGHWGKIDTRYSVGSGYFHFDDLLIACALIQGAEIPTYANNSYAKIRSVEDRATEVDFGYFRVQAFKNGNVKVNWHDKFIHVLEKLNNIGAGRENDLPDTMRKRYKSEHFHNGGEPSAAVFFKPDPEKDPSNAKDFAFFPTPAAVAAQMVDLAEVVPGMSVLEPSAGEGAIYDAIPEECPAILIEYNHHRAAALKARARAGASVHEGDFLKGEPTAGFDRVLMNPPFNDRVEAVHVVKAFQHLLPGGILCAIIPEGWFFRDDLKSRIFRNFLTENEHQAPVKLERGTFGKTGVQTRIVTLKKPAGDAE